MIRIPIFLSRFVSAAFCYALYGFPQGSYSTKEYSYTGYRYTSRWQSGEILRVDHSANKARHGDPRKKTLIDSN